MTYYQGFPFFHDLIYFPNNYFLRKPECMGVLMELLQGCWTILWNISNRSHFGSNINDHYFPFTFRALLANSIRPWYEVVIDKFSTKYNHVTVSLQQLELIQMTHIGRYRLASVCIRFTNGKPFRLKLRNYRLIPIENTNKGLTVSETLTVQLSQPTAMESFRCYNFLKKKTT